MSNIQYKVDENTAIEMLYRNRDISSVSVQAQLSDQYNQVCDLLEIPEIHSHIEHTKEFLIPEYYKQIDIEEHLRGLVSNQGCEIAAARVETELALFKARNLYPVLQLMIYIVDTMRKHNIVWGVGRGSSVASYCLYLIGVHKIDSIKYNLDIREFLK
jgi:DNA polymerase III alpha subunit